MQPDLSLRPIGAGAGTEILLAHAEGKCRARELPLPFLPRPRDGFWHWLFGGPEKSSIRAGYGIYYDHYGEGIVNLFDQYGSFGLSQSITNPTNLLTPDTSPRFTGIHDLPDITGFPASTINVPGAGAQQPALDGL